MMAGVRGSLLVAGTTCFVVPIMAQQTAITEVHDEVRGVIFSSVQISEDAANEWDLVRGAFANSDRVRLGLSALVLDEVESVDEYIFWIRHEGRRWLSFFDPEDAVTLLIGGGSFDLEPLRRPQPFLQAGLLVETLEFKLRADDLWALLQSDEVTLIVRTATGTIEKNLGEEELTAMARLKERLRTRGF